MRREALRIESEVAKPMPRLALMSAIRAAGYRWNRELCPIVRVSETRLSKILRGHELPPPAVQRRLAKALGLTIAGLAQLL
jgi:hypothetical protein